MGLAVIHKIDQIPPSVFSNLNIYLPEQIRLKPAQFLYSAEEKKKIIAQITSEEPTHQKQGAENPDSLLLVC